MKRLMMEWAFQFVDNILFYIDEKNVRSQRAIEKIGGERIIALEGAVLEGRPGASVIYQITKKKWDRHSRSVEGN